MQDVAPRSAAARAGVRPGDELLAVNGRRVEDVIDVQYYGAEEHLSLLVRRDGDPVALETGRRYGQALGLTFAHPTFDTDIRRCNNLCEFCFVLQMAPRFRRTLYIKDDDYRYSFLFGHFVTLTNLTEHDWWRIETMGLSPLYVSVHVTDLERRRQFLRNADAPDIMAQLRWLAARGIVMHTQLVVVPGLNDGEWLQRSLADLATLHPAVASISVVPVGLTRQHKYGMRPHTHAEAAAMLDLLEARQVDFQTRFGARFVYPTDEWYLVAGRTVPEADAYDGLELHENGLGMVRRFLDDWAGLAAEIEAWQAGEPARATALRGRRLTLVTGTLFAGTLRETAAAMSERTGVALEVVPVVNERLGPTITVAGLLMGADVLDALAPVDPGDLIVLPRVMFDHPDRITLDDISPQEIANRLGHPVALADGLGDVWDALTERSPLIYRPDGDPAPSPPHRTQDESDRGRGRLSGRVLD